MSVWQDLGLAYQKSQQLGVRDNRLAFWSDILRTLKVLTMQQRCWVLIVLGEHLQVRLSYIYYVKLKCLVEIINTANKRLRKSDTIAHHIGFRKNKANISKNFTKTILQPQRTG